MDKVNGANSQAMPLWDRQKSQRGHYSSVDKALEAHRQRKAERQARIEDRLNMVNNIHNNFFPTSNVAQRSALEDPSFQSQPLDPVQQLDNPLQVATTPTAVEAPAVEFNSLPPMEMDEIYKEASLGSVADNALGVIQREVANPEDVPADEVPKGSYVDYTV
jgi:hypothetical protein